MSLDEDLRNLSRIPVFATLETDARRLIAFTGESRILRAGDVLFHKGEVGDGGYIVQSGCIALTVEDHGGGTPVELVYPHTLIGEIALISDVERSVTAYAKDPTTVLKISRVLFHRVLKEHPISAARLRAFLEKRLLDFTRDLAASPSASGSPGERHPDASA
jgi:CRP-like cAMP-binding protein